MSTPQAGSQESEAAPAQNSPMIANFSHSSTAGANPNLNSVASADARPVPEIAVAPPLGANPTTNASPATAAPTQPSQVTSTEDPQTFNDKLNASDRYWKFKLGLAGVLIITGLIGIGCFGWLMSSDPYNSYSSYSYYDGYMSVWPSFITWGTSILFCVACVATFLLRKRSVHPGLRVSIDLLLWLGFLVTALFATSAFVDLTYWGSYGSLYDSSYWYNSNSGSNGDYVLESNGTWVWEQDSSYVNIQRSCNSTETYHGLPLFANCAQQDAYVNQLWHDKPHRVSVTLTGVVCQWFGMVLHFVLFVWACVDTHRHRRGKVSKDAEKLAAGIVQTMIQNGAVVPPPGQQYRNPGAGQPVYYMLPSQQPFPQQGNMQSQPYATSNMHPAYRMPPQSQQMTPGHFHPHPVQQQQGYMGPAAGQSNEKGQPRYA